MICDRVQNYIVHVHCRCFSRLYSIIFSFKMSILLPAAPKGRKGGTARSLKIQPFSCDILENLRHRICPLQKYYLTSIIDSGIKTKTTISQGQSEQSFTTINSLPNHPSPSPTPRYMKIKISKTT